MTDTIFRQKQPKVEETSHTIKKSEDGGTIVSSDVEVPYLDYHQQNGKPFLVEEFKLGDMWDDPVGGFSEEVSTIENYLKQQIEHGEVANSVSAIKNLLKQIEKVTGVGKEERIAVKMGMIASYTKFLTDKERIKSNMRKYNNI